MQNPSLTFFSLMQGREKNTAVKHHVHDCFELVFFDQADGVLTMHQDTYPLQDGTLYLVYPNTPHSEVHFSNATVSFLGFRCPDFPRHAIKEAAFSMLRHEEIGSMMKKIMKEATEQKAYYDALISHLLAEVILLLARFAAGNEQQPKNLGYIASYITEYFNQPLDLLQLAKDTGYSPDYFRHRFADEFGMSPKQFQIEVRLKKAAELLLNSKKILYGNRCALRIFNRLPILCHVFKKVSNDTQSVPSMRRIFYFVSFFTKSSYNASR